MSAPTAAVNPVQPAPPPARPAAGPASANDDSRFDRHLDAARQQHGQAQDKPAHEDDARDPAAKDSSTASASHGRPAETPAKNEGSPDAAALAAAMLALIGQAAPAKPLAQGGTAAPAGAKTVGAAAGANANAPAALVLLANTAAAASIGKSPIGLDANALAPMLGKPAEQKDALLDPTQLAGIANTPPPAQNTGGATLPAHQLNVASPAGTPAFAQELGEHVAWLGQQDVKQARIRLHPEDLGTLDVKVSVHHDRVDVNFAVQHPAAVHVVQQTLPQLDALLAQHGLALGQADVGQRQQHGDGGRDGQASGAIGEIEPDQGVLASTPVAALGILDTFA
ncbi:flagellar hook-length control protein FliK [Frateuria sp. STR12]|uniref:flagellar hook-length control protein FliK n=1 Tax=Frateuria hangzhouensis TaxID=2995589 RepID=UPI0022608D5F|nr:flagellar hook-length control protein FliK [Frateuria sp. STR12]MCX7513145.1 flagellar hook-length control protein FliK [Frateuria sp. STR12]